MIMLKDVIISEYLAISGGRVKRPSRTTAAMA